MFRRPSRDWSIDPPAGTGNRPALPISELDPIAWNALVVRASQLPVQHVHDRLDFMVLGAEEFRAALRIGRALDVDDDDQLFSLARRHRDHVEKLVAQLGPLHKLGRPATGSRTHFRQVIWRDLEVPFPTRGVGSSSR